MLPNENNDENQYDILMIKESTDRRLVVGEWILWLFEWNSTFSENMRIKSANLII